MANECSFCGKRHIDTNILVLGGSWLEFCKECGEKEMLTSVDGVQASVAEVFRGIQSTDEPALRWLPAEYRFFANFFDKRGLLLGSEEITVQALDCCMAGRMAERKAEEYASFKYQWSSADKLWEVFPGRK